MAFMDWFNKKGPSDPLKDLVLSKLRTGYLVDYDLKTWEITDHYRYDYGDGYMTEEWELTADGEKWYLERDEDDEVEWSFSKKIPIGTIEGDIRQNVIEHGEPPDQIVCNGTTYYLDESGSGVMHKQNQAAQKFRYWDFIDKGNEHFVTIEQWGKTEFEAVEGYSVEEYQFTKILPGGA